MSGYNMVHSSAQLAEGVLESLPKGIYIGENAVVQEGVKLGELCYIGAGAQIGSFSTLGEHVRIGSNSKLDTGVKLGHRAYVGSNVRIEDWARIGDGADIGPGAQIGHSIEIPSRVKVAASAVILDDDKHHVWGRFGGYRAGGCWVRGAQSEGGLHRWVQYGCEGMRLEEWKEEGVVRERCLNHEEYRADWYEESVWGWITFVESFLREPPVYSEGGER